MSNHVAPFLLALLVVYFATLAVEAYKSEPEPDIAAECAKQGKKATVVSVVPYRLDCP